MIVIVETTFIVEIVLEQDQSPACEEIIQLAASTQSITLVVPAFSMAEAGMTLERRRGERRSFLRALNAETRNVRRSKVLSNYGQLLTDLKSELVVAENTEDQRYNYFCGSPMRSAKTIALTEQIVRDAVVYRKGGVAQKLPDALVLTSILSYLDAIRSESQPPTCLVTPDKAFMEAVHGFNCVPIRSFNDALAWVQRYNRPSS